MRLKRVFTMAAAAAMLAALPALTEGGRATAGDEGGRTVSLTLNNLTPAPLTVGGIIVSDATWVGARLEPGDTLPPASSRLIRVETKGGSGDDSRKSVVELEGYGMPIFVVWTIDAHGKFDVTAASTDEVDIHVQRITDPPHANITMVDRR